jgi:hypothetical protein
VKEETDTHCRVELNTQSRLYNIEKSNLENASDVHRLVGKLNENDEIINNLNPTSLYAPCSPECSSLYAPYSPYSSSSSNINQQFPPNTPFLSYSSFNSATPLHPTVYAPNTPFLPSTSPLHPSYMSYQSSSGGMSTTPLHPSSSGSTTPLHQSYRK